MAGSAPGYIYSGSAVVGRWFSVVARIGHDKHRCVRKIADARVVGYLGNAPLPLAGARGAGAPAGLFVTYRADPGTYRMRWDDEP